MTSIINRAIPTLTARVNLFPTLRNSNGEYIDRSPDSKCVQEEVGKRIGKYYTKEMNKPVGIAGATALFENFTAGILWYFIRGASTFTNWMTSLAELFQVGIANTKILGDPNDESNPKEAEIAELRRESAMAWTQVLAGTVGLGSCGLDFITKPDTELEELSASKKSVLSIASAACSVLMFFGFGEKTLMASMANGHSTESKNMRMNGDSDERCAYEWATMAVLSWFSKIKLFKAVVDLLVPLFAFREGVEHFMHNKVNFVFNKNVYKIEDVYGKKIKNFLQGSLFINDNDDYEKKQGKTHCPFNTKWFLGDKSNPGFRTRVLVPILGLFGCDNYLPLCHSKEINGKLFVVINFYNTDGNNVSSKEDLEETNNQIVKLDQEIPPREVKRTARIAIG